ncbi:Mammalian cell entry related domain protein [Chloroherpeton thalassium ATCC 35110]|uniref:Mammalian cell entry related domain protein n=1 Tax=Chloroherpeton thalassium (strain ATCC 35110 / GB-78) TaxID=517418 RepID=B3QRY4_CHLT3|nr:MlaD family protein [Chloroherpeton thalassium]ACF13937.1 Mammalian cell entry related domain protein [Chloroherpeton thalassium ATCC 35110]
MNKEFKVGLTVTLALLLLGASLIWVKDVQVGTKTANILFSNVSGLEIGSPVTINGVKKGKVEALQILGSNVNAQISLAPDVTVYRDATARLLMRELMTGKKIELEPGTPASGELPPGDLIQGLFIADIPELVGYAGEAIDTLRILVGDMRQTLHNANMIIGDQALQEDLKITIKNIRLASSDLVQISRDMRTVDIKGIAQKVDTTLVNINEFSSRLEPELTQTVKHVQGTLTHADTLIESLQDLTSRLSTDKQTLAGKILNDPKFMAKIDSVVTDLDSLVRRGYDDGINVRLKLF